MLSVHRRLGLVLVALAVSQLASNVDAAPAAATHSDDAALTRLSREWKSLSADLRRRRQRDHWETLIRGFEKIGHSGSVPSIRAQALYRAGGAAEEMSTISRRRKDAVRAEDLYLEAAHLKTPVAPEALNAAAQIAQEQLGSPVRARTLRAQATAISRDESAPAKQAEAAAATPAKQAEAPAPTPPPAETVVSEPGQLRDATAAWKHLQEDVAHRRQREPWLTVIAKLEAAGEALAPAEAGARAYLRAAQATEELHRASFQKADLRRAAAAYETVATKCPHSTVAEEALLTAAALHRGPLKDVEAARRALKQAVALAGSHTSEARQLLAALPPPPKPLTEAEETAVIADVLDSKTKATPPPVALVAPAPTTDAPAIAAALAAAVPPAQPAPAVVAPAAVAAAPPAPVISAPELKRLKRNVMSDTTLSISDQTGLKIKRIIVDAGHGGKDDGATGPKGVHEKDVTLAIAHDLANTLKARGYDVVLTRGDDTFVALDDRTEIANREKGDLFISIHANASPTRRQTGVETYALNIASNRFAARLAARENASCTRSVSELQYLLADLATRANTIDSDRFADYVETSVVSGIGRKYTRPKELGVKHALFFVLLGTRMPAILVETGFISNPTEEKRLASPTYQSIVAESIAHAVDQFVARRRQFASAVP